MSKVEEFSQISGAPTLRRLSLNYVLAGRLDWLRNLPQLEELSLRCCDGVKDFTPIGYPQQLRELDIADTRVEDYSWMRGLIPLDRVRFLESQCMENAHLAGNVEAYLPLVKNGGGFVCFWFYKWRSAFS